MNSESEWTLVEEVSLSSPRSPRRYHQENKSTISVGTVGLGTFLHNYPTGTTPLSRILPRGPWYSTEKHVAVVMTL